MHAAAEEAGVFLQDAMVSSCAAATQSSHTPHVQAFQAGGLVCMWLRLVAVKTD